MDVVHSELQFMRAEETVPFELINLLPFRVFTFPGLPIPKPAACRFNQQFIGSRTVRGHVRVEAFVTELRNEQ